jgi:hypothetical protein
VRVRAVLQELPQDGGGCHSPFGGRNVLLGEFSFFEQKIEGIHSFSTV